MKSYAIGFFVSGLGLIIALVLWVVGYIYLPNAATHRHLAQNQAIQTSATNSSATSTSSSGGSSSSSSGGSTSSNTAFYSLDKAANTVDFNIIAGDASVESGMNFNGYYNGQMDITVPVGWKVKIAFKNVSSSMPHSVGFVAWNQRTNFNAPAAFSGSIGPNFNSGMMAADGTKNFSFTASKAGKYAMICGIPGHAAAGMWDEFDVSSTAKAPTVKTPSGTVTVQ